MSKHDITDDEARDVLHLHEKFSQLVTKYGPASDWGQYYNAFRRRHNYEVSHARWHLSGRPKIPPLQEQ